MSSGTSYGPQSFLTKRQGMWRKVQLMAICAALLVVSMSATAAQDEGLTYHIHKRNSNIDPFWYVDRGVRPIGRFGKRQVMSNHKVRLPNSLEMILNAMRAQNALDPKQQQDEVTY